MNIVYHQHGNFVFLKEGLAQLGHNIFPISFREGESFDEQVYAVCKDVDIVFFEMYGPFKLPADMEKSQICRVAYCIDGPMYEFFLIHTMKLFDYVFVDQRSTVDILLKYGIKSSWLPLCVPNDNFRSSTPKKYDITFVGHISSDRTKRKNLLDLVKNNFSLNYVFGVDLHTMLDIFAESKIVLNENHFNGINLRLFQALASGSLLLTEKDSDGLEALFEDGKHLITYTSDTIISKIKEYLNSDQREKIAYNGYIECKNKHSSLARAKECLKIIANKDQRNLSRDEDELLLAQASAIYIRTIRFGGTYKWSMDLVKRGIGCNGKHIGQLYTLLGMMSYTIGQTEQAEHYFYKGFSNGDKITALAQLILMYVHNKNFERAKKLLYMLIDLFNGKCDYIIKFINDEIKGFSRESQLFFSLARILFESGNIYFVGFNSALGIDRYLPITAVEVAYMAWKIEYNPTILDFIIHCYKIKQIDTEATLLLKIAKDKNVITKRQERLYTNLLHKAYS